MPTSLHPRWLRHLTQRPRLMLAIGCTLTIFGLALWWWPGHVIANALIAYNVGAIIYLVLAARLMLHAEPATMRDRARAQNYGRFAVLFTVVAASVLALLAIAAQLAVAKNFSGVARDAHIALAGLTVITSWSFTQVMFALHYAHDYYGGDEHAPPGGLDFPGTKTPDYMDFLYVACSIGTSGQAADVAFTSSGLRRVGLLHCVLAFFYNATLIAFTINIAAQLL